MSHSPTDNSGVSLCHALVSMLAFIFMVATGKAPVAADLGGSLDFAHQTTNWLSLQ